MNAYTPYGLAVLTIAGLSASLLWAGNMTQQGTLGTVDEFKVVLVTHALDVTFQINSSTQVTMDGRMVRASDLRIGDTATIEFSAQDDSSPLALRIDAQRPSDPESPDPVPKR